MKILRIPVTYWCQIKYLSKDDADYVLKSLFKLSSDSTYKIEDSMRWWLIISMWREIIQIENKARAKKWLKWLKEEVATLSSDIGAQNVRPIQVKSIQVKSIQVKSNQVKSNQVKSVAILTKSHSLKDLMVNNIDKNKYIEKWFDDKLVTLEMNKFYNRWSQKNAWWKKEHWEKQKTFDVARRFISWMSKIKIEDKTPNRNLMTDKQKTQRLQDLWIL